VSRRPCTGITPLEKRILHLLVDQGPQRAQDLVQRLGCSRPGLTEAGARMEGFGWIGRSRRWSIRARGRQRLAQRLMIPRRSSRRRGAAPGEAAGVRSARTASL